MNRVQLMGHLTRDVELRYAGTGTAVANFGLAANTVSGKGENKKEEVYFANCVCFGKTAERLSRDCKKGSLVQVEGRLKEDKWEKDGVEQRKTVVNCFSALPILWSKEPAARQESSGSGGDDDSPF